MTSATAIHAELEFSFRQALDELLEKSENLVRKKEKGRPQNLYQEAQEIFSATKQIPRLAAQAGIVYETVKQELKEIRHNLYEVLSTVEQRKRTWGSTWRKTMSFLKGALEVISNLYGLLPVMVASTTLLVPELSHQLMHLVPHL